MARQLTSVEIDSVEYHGSFEIEGNILTVKTADAEMAVLCTVNCPEGLARTLLRTIVRERAAARLAQVESDPSAAFLFGPAEPDRPVERTISLVAEEGFEPPTKGL